MKKNLYLNDINIGDYGIFINSDTYLDAPQIDYTSYNIPARNGSVIQYNKRFENVVRKFECYIPDTQVVQTALDNLKKLIYSNTGYIKISSDYEPDCFMYGYMAQDINVEPFNNELTAEFELYFSCMPQKISVNGNEYTYSRQLQGDVYIYNINNSDNVRNALAMLPFYAYKFNTYAICKITQLGLTGSVRVQMSFTLNDGLFLTVCTMQNNEPVFVDYIGYFNVTEGQYINVPDEYNTSEYYLCAYAPTGSRWNALTFNIGYGTNYGTSMSKTFTLGYTFSAPSNMIGITGEIWMGLNLTTFTEQNISDGLWKNSDGIIAFNDTYVKVNWWQMYMDGMFEMMRQFFKITSYGNYIAFYIDLLTKKCYLRHPNTDVLVDIDKYCTIYGNFDVMFDTTNKLCASRISDISGLSPAVRQYYDVRAFLNVNWWKV